MLTKPEKGTINAIAQLARSPWGEEFLKYLDSELAATQDALLDAPDGQRYLRLQGRGKLLKEILELVRKAPELLDKPR